MSEDILIHSPIELTLMEIHTLAYMYHWGSEECWDMPVTRRGVFVDMIQKQIRVENKGVNNGSPSKSSYKESK